MFEILVSRFLARVSDIPTYFSWTFSFLSQGCQKYHYYLHYFHLEVLVLRLSKANLNRLGQLELELGGDGSVASDLGQRCGAEWILIEFREDAR